MPINLSRTIIGLAGVKTSGKSTVANIIKELLGENIQVVELALADKLKNTCAEVFGLKREVFDRQDIKEVSFKDGPKLLTIIKITNILNSFGVVVTQDLIDTYEENGIVDMPLETPRKIVQIVGTEVLRATGNEDIHCDNVPLAKTGIIIISDLRFPNEFKYFSKMTDGSMFLPLYIQRDEAEKHITKDSHPSETSVFKFNMHCKKINNNGSLDSLKTQIKTLLENEGYIERKSKGA